MKARGSSDGRPSAWNVTVSRGAEKSLAAIAKGDAEAAEQIASKLRELASTFLPSGSKKLKGRQDEYRIRVGDYRILYKVIKREKLVKVTTIDKRGQAGLYD